MVRRRLLLSAAGCHAGGDGPKLIELLQMREKHMLQDRITLLGSVRHEDVRSVSPPSACSSH